MRICCQEAAKRVLGVLFDTWAFLSAEISNLCIRSNIDQPAVTQLTQYPKYPSVFHGFFSFLITMARGLLVFLLFCIVAASAETFTLPYATYRSANVSGAFPQEVILAPGSVDLFAIDSTNNCTIHFSQLLGVMEAFDVSSKAENSKTTFFRIPPPLIRSNSTCAISGDLPLCQDYWEICKDAWLSNTFTLEGFQGPTWSEYTFTTAGTYPYLAGRFIYTGNDSTTGFTAKVKDASCFAGMPAWQIVIIIAAILIVLILVAAVIVHFVRLRARESYAPIH